ncbi:response regulator transcription factor [Xiamenia xianingshaonis]|uniref:response regulator transcription factor n=1 Tax=Xiamenia xianingshaonis TaxID=2682776 RepID=UPI00140C9CDE|nr:response regulator transcription factor [Xiamenia xianingshaonis]
MKALVVEDNESVARLVKCGFEAAGWVVDAVFSGEEGLLLALDARQAYDLAVIDRMLPVVDGLAIVRGMREKGIETPVIVLTALGSVENRIEGLDAGADDYMAKPFAVEELLARARALLRRPSVLAATSFSFGDLVFDPASRVLTVAGSCEVNLSGRESSMMEALILAKGSPLSRSQLLAKVWGIDHPVEAANVDNYAYFLRRKLKGAKSSVELESIRGLGYRLVEKA